MAHRNKVMQSINAPDGFVCVDIFKRPDGSFGFDEYRRDPEDPSGWFCIGHHADRIFETELAAQIAAKQSVVWL